MAFVHSDSFMQRIDDRIVEGERVDESFFTDEID